MPTYEYECLKCGKVSEVFQRMSAPPIKECPHCKGGVRKKISGGSGLIFKGSGFYITDYKKKSTVTENKKEEIKKTDSPAPKKCDSCPDTGCPQAKKKQ